MTFNYTDFGGNKNPVDYITIMLLHFVVFIHVIYLILLSKIVVRGLPLYLVYFLSITNSVTNYN